MTGRGGFGKSLGLGFALVLVTALAYFPMNWASYLYDDHDYLLQNLTILDPSGLWKIFFMPRASPQYYPLVFAGFWVEYRLWGFDLPSYHRVNVVLHALNALLVWRAARRLIPSGAWLAGMIFAIHPVHVESVAWITERKNVLSGFFYLSALLAYWRFAPPTAAREGVEPKAREKPAWAWYGLAFVLYVAALGSKTVTCSLPAAILVIAWGRSGRIGLREVAPLVPFFVVGVLASGMTSWMERNQSAQVASELVFSPIDRLLIAGRAFWFYGTKDLWPTHLSLLYPRWQVDPRIWWQDAYPLGALSLIVALWAFRQRIGRWPLASVLFFAGTLVPTLGFVSFYYMIISFVADHFQYLASLGLIVPTACLIRRLGLALDRRLVCSGTVAITILVLTLWIATASRALTFADRDSIWADTLVKDPDSWMALNNLGTVYWERRQVAQAEAYFQSALRLRPSLAEAHANLGYVFWWKREDMKAERSFRKATELNPYDWRPRFPLGVIYHTIGRDREAAEQLRFFLIFEPGHLDARQILAEIESKR